MSVSLFTCPVPTALPDVSNPDNCLAAYGNVGAVALQLYQGTPSFDGTTNLISAQASWTTLLASATATRVVVVPVVNFETTPGEAITEGGNDQTTHKGMPKLKHGGFSPVTLNYEGISAALAKEIRGLTQFSRVGGGRTLLRTFLLTDENYIISNSDFNGIETYAFFIGDVKKGGGYKMEDSYPGSWAYPYGWSHDMVVTKASFDVLALQNA